MKLLLFICLAFVCTSGEDEQLGELVNLLKDPKFSSDLLAELQKRISDGTENDKTPPTNECKFVMNDTTIIKTKASLSNGASFIEAPQQTAGVPVDQETCLRSCCQNVNCTVAVVKKTENGCYLFNCGRTNKCLYSSHPDFAVMSLAGPHVIIPPATQHEQKQHENALEGLVTVPTTSKKPTTTPSTPKPVPTTPKQPVPLFGDCEENRDCMGSFTECIGSLCLCQKGYHAQDGMCRSDCNRFEFECANEGAPLAVPQCIAVYDRCDGIKHCRDGSDEMKCEPPSTPESGNKKEPPQTNKDKEQHPTPDTTNREPQDKPHPPAETQDKHTDTESQHSESEMKHEQEKPSEETGEKDENSKEEEEKSNEDNDSKGDDKTDSKSDEKEPENKPDTEQSSQKTEDSEKDEDDSESVSKEDKNTDTKDSPPPTGEAEKEGKENGSEQVKRVMSAGSSLELSDEEVKKVKEYHKLSTKGPMIALALGLAITAMLLVFVGCRLRNVKHRLRRGRPVHSNEADYLINGMYL